MVFVSKLARWPLNLVINVVDKKSDSTDACGVSMETAFGVTEQRNVKSVRKC